MKIIAEEIAGKEHWKLWLVDPDNSNKSDVGYVSFAMGARELILLVAEMEDRWSSETKNLMHNSQVMMNNHIVSSDCPIPYIQMSVEDES